MSRLFYVWSITISPQLCSMCSDNIVKKKKKKGRALWRPADSQVRVHHPASNSVQSTLFILKTCAGANFVPAVQEIQQSRCRCVTIKDSTDRSRQRGETVSQDADDTAGFLFVQGKESRASLIISPLERPRYNPTLREQKDSTKRLCCICCTLLGQCCIYYVYTSACCNIT